MYVPFILVYVYVCVYVCRVYLYAYIYVCECWRAYVPFPQYFACYLLSFIHLHSNMYMYLCIHVCVFISICVWLLSFCKRFIDMSIISCCCSCSVSPTFYAISIACFPFFSSSFYWQRTLTLLKLHICLYNVCLMLPVFHIHVHMYCCNMGRLVDEDISNLVLAFQFYEFTDLCDSHLWDFCFGLYCRQIKLKDFLLCQ